MIFRLLRFCFEENASGDTIGGLGFKIDQSQGPIVLVTSHSQSSGKSVNLLRLYNIFCEPLVYILLLMFVKQLRIC